MIEIQVNNLVKSFEMGHNVLDGVTFQIDQGQRVGLLGKNGAGKSTLFKILIGELDYDEGTVTISPGHRMYTSYRKENKRLLAVWAVPLQFPARSLLSTWTCRT